MSVSISRPASPVADRDHVVDRIRSLLREGAPWAASDVYRAAIDAYREDAELTYWGALAFARCGATREARALLDRVRRSPDAPGEIRRESLCLSGRLWKDRIDRTNPGEHSGIDAIRLALDDYLAAYVVDGAAYPAANAATLSMLLHDEATATRLATEVLVRLAARSGSLDAWDEATRGEALLLLGDVDGARDAYRRASELAHDDAGSIASMRRQLALLERVVPAARQVLDTLPSATVLAFAGHMIDASDRAAARFPPSLEPVVADRIRTYLASLHRPIVYTSAACGSDVLLIEAALDIDAEINLVLPFDRDDFVATSVAFAGEHWVERYEQALKHATRVIQATDERHLGDDVLFAHAQHLVGGLAVLRASQLHTTASLLCVLDARSPDPVGSTRGFCEQWAQSGRPLGTIALDAGTGRVGHAGTGPADVRARPRTGARSLPRPSEPHPSEPRPSESQPSESQPSTPDRPPRSLKTTLFADIAGFGALQDSDAPLFRSRFLGIVADRIAALPTPPLEANTWGDALYVVFEDVEDAAAFAVSFVDRIDEVDWTTTGLSATSHVRVALHAGPVFCGFDPIVGHDCYFGTSVTKTARIEPITPPGLVYASEAFVATLALRPSNAYVFEYVGDIALAKNYGTSRIYRLERR